MTPNGRRVSVSVAKILAKRQLNVNQKHNQKPTICQVNYFSFKFQQLSKGKGLVQADLVGILGKDKSTISKWWNGEVIPGPKNTKAIAEYFGVSVAYLRASGEHLEAGPDDMPKKLKPTTSCPCIPRAPDKYETLGRDVAEWARAASEKSGVFDYCDGIRIAIAQTYPEFEEWLKKRNNGGDMETMPRKKVSNSD